MDFRAAARHLAVNVDDDMDIGSTMTDDMRRYPNGFAGQPSTDGMDPASPGGPAPYNGADPFGEPVTDNPEWLDPSQPRENQRGQRMPYTPGPDVDTTTLHNARRALYAAKERTRS